MTKKEIKDIISEWNILFVDDEEFVVDTMKEILPMLFKKSYFALNGFDGIEEFKNNNIDLIITDLSMPKLNGVEMIMEIRKINPDIKVIFVSGHNESEYIQSANELDASFIIKPISSNELYKAIEQIL